MIVLSNILFHKVLQLPETLESNAFYFVENGEFADSYITTSGPDPQARQIGRSAAQINSMIDAKLDQHNSLKIVADITERDILADDLNRNIVVLVTDATDDETVDVGAALYAYDAELDTFTKIAEYESMDIVLEWDAIEGRPESSVEDIDAAVEQRHIHENKDLLDLIDEGSFITQEERDKLAGITDLGSGAIITEAERDKLAAIETTGSGHIITDEEREKLANIQEGATKNEWTIIEW